MDRENTMEVAPPSPSRRGRRVASYGPPDRLLRAGHQSNRSHFQV
ncbi:MAG: hypothetical protein Q6373_002110 [Candidatus Sigynarchaeota archaeon]